MLTNSGICSFSVGHGICVSGMADVSNSCLLKLCWSMAQFVGL